jgi:hypothetical protein
MDENLTRHADSRIQGNGVILSGFKSTQNPRQNPRIPHGFHTKWPLMASHSALPGQQTKAQIPMYLYINPSSAGLLADPPSIDSQQVVRLCA